MNMNFTDLIGYSAATIGAFLFLPQVIHTIKTKDTKGLSLITLILTTSVSSLWAIYGILTVDYAIILAQVFLFPMVICVLGFKLKYG